MAPQETTRPDVHEEGYLQNSYDALKTEVIEQLEAHCLDKWKDVLNVFCRDIGSPRTLSKLRISPDLNALVKILEYRDCLSSDNVDALVNLAHFVKCPSVVYTIDQYKKLNGIALDLLNPPCNICGESFAESQPVIPSTQSPYQRESQALDNALEVIIPRLSMDAASESWIKVARALDFAEGEIDSLELDIVELSETEPAELATKDVLHNMFKQWRKRQKMERREANVKKLKKALVQARQPDLANLLD